MNTHKRQLGSSLIVSLIMLLVLTMLVIAAIRSGNTNLRIAGNMQAQTEAADVAQQAIEQVIDVGTGAIPKDFTITTDQTNSVTIGATTYAVHVFAPSCEESVPVLSNDPSLSPSDPNDKICLGSDDGGDPILDASGKPVAKATTCNQQNWQIKVNATNTDTNASTTLHQGVAKRMYTPSPCT